MQLRWIGNGVRSGIVTHRPVRGIIGMATSSYTTTPWSAEELSVTLFEEAGDALFLFDPESEQLVDVNPMAQRLSGFSRVELLRHPITYLIRSEVQGGLNRLRH